MLVRKSLAKFVLMGFVGFLNLGCPGDKCGDAACGDAFQYDIDPAVSALSGIEDDQTASSFAFKKPSLSKILISQILETPAWAAACSRAGASACSSQTEVTTYSGCSIGSSGQTYNGSVTLTYTGTASCGFSSNGDTVVRTLSTTKTLPNNQSISNSSTATTNFQGTSVGGGSRLTLTGTNTYNLDILGLHKVVTNQSSQTVVDLTIQTTSTIAISGSLGRNGRVLNGGAVQIVDNSSQIVSSWVPNNLSYSGSCCYPTSGSITATFSGRRSGQATVTFTSCGTATVSSSGNTAYPITLTSCE